jgi:predicted phosphoribosyltransferase
MAGGWSGSGQFASLDEGGEALAAVLPDARAAWPPGASVAVLAVVPNGVPAGVHAAAALGAPLAGVEVRRDDAGLEVVGLVLPDAEVVVVADDAVETGTAAAAIAAAVRAASSERGGAGPRLVLAVPVCPRESASALAGLYDEVVAPVRPLGRRDLRWHYPGFSPLDPDDARARVVAYEAVRTAG